MRKLSMITIDGDALKRALEQRDLTGTRVSRDMGYNDGYIANAINRNSITPSGAKMLDVMYGIPLSEYEKKEQAVETVEQIEETAKEEINVIDYDKLYQIIYVAVYDAVKRAWSE